MRHPRFFVQLLVALLLCLTMTMPASAKGTAYRTGFTRWRAADGAFSGWALIRRSARLQCAAARSSARQRWHRSLSARRLQWRATSTTAAASASARRPARSCRRLRLPRGDRLLERRPRPPAPGSRRRSAPGSAARWTKWYNLGVWAADDSTIERHSVKLQGDADGFVAVDTLVLTNKKATADAFQLKLRLFSANRAAIPSVRNASVAHLDHAGEAAIRLRRATRLWDQLLAVPECSQMVYPDGGEVWCSPTSTSMVLALLGRATPARASRACARPSRASTTGSTTATATGRSTPPTPPTQGLEGYVARFTSLAQAEPWIAAGVPVVISYRLEATAS